MRCGKGILTCEVRASENNSRLISNIEHVIGHDGGVALRASLSSAAPPDAFMLGPVAAHLGFLPFPKMPIIHVGLGFIRAAALHPNTRPCRRRTIVNKFIWPATAYAPYGLTEEANGHEFQCEWQGGVDRCAAGNPAVMGDPRRAEAHRD